MTSKEFYDDMKKTNQQIGYLKASNDIFDEIKRHQEMGARTITLLELVDILLKLQWKI